MSMHRVSGPPAWTARAVTALTIAFGLTAAIPLAQAEALTINDNRSRRSRIPQRRPAGSAEGDRSAAGCPSAPTSPW